MAASLNPGRWNAAPALRRTRSPRWSTRPRVANAGRGGDRTAPSWRRNEPLWRNLPRGRHIKPRKSEPKRRASIDEASSTVGRVPVAPGRQSGSIHARNHHRNRTWRAPSGWTSAKRCRGSTGGLSLGEHWLVRGPNGSGKSTFLRMLHGQLRPALGGSIRFPGIDNPDNVWDLRKQVAWVSPELQAGYWYPSTARQCIYSGFDSSIGQTRRMTAAEDRVGGRAAGAVPARRLGGAQHQERCPTGSSAACSSPAPWCTNPRCCCWTSRGRAWTTTTGTLVNRELAQIVARGTHLVSPPATWAITPAAVQPAPGIGGRQKCRIERVARPCVPSRGTQFG